MMYLEERKLVHRDLAARNVLVGEKISGVPVVKVNNYLSFLSYSYEFFLVRELFVYLGIKLQ